DIGILTSIAPSHMQYLGSLEQIAAEKRILLEASRLRFCSDQAWKWLQPGIPDTTIYGPATAAAERGQLQAGPAGSQSLLYRNESWQLPLPGSASATNLTGALAVAFALGVGSDEARERLSRVQMTA